MVFCSISSFSFILYPNMMWCIKNIFLLFDRNHSHSLPVMGLFLESVFSAAGLDWLLDLAVVPLVASTSRLRRALERLPARGGGLPLDTEMDFFPEFLEPPLLADWLCLGVLCCERGLEWPDSACFDLVFKRPPLLLWSGSLMASFLDTLLNKWKKENNLHDTSGLFLHKFTK